MADDREPNPGPYPDAGETFLVEAALDGDARAFEAIVRRQEGTVLRVLRLMGVRAEEREDAAQDVFLRVFRSLHRFEKGRPLEGWIYRMTANVALDRRKRAGREAARNVSLDAEGAPEPAVESRAPAADLARRLEAALETLTERERAVFVLRELEGLETVAVARALGVTQITVRRHLGLARERLRKSLESEEISDSD